MPNGFSSLPKTTSTTKTTLGLGIALAILLALVSSAVHAANITVAAGEVDISANGTCSLLEAIENANDTTDGNVYTDCTSGNPGGADTISLSNSTYNLTASQASALGPSGLVITSDITITGNGATIRRNSGGNYRLFYVSAAGDLTLDDVTLDNGSARGGNGGKGVTGSSPGFGGGGGGGGLGGNGANGTAVSNCTNKSKGGGGGGEQGSASGTSGGATTGGNGSTGSGGQAGGVGGGGGGGGQSGGCGARGGGAGGFGGGGGGGGNATDGAAGGFGAGGGGAGLNNNTQTKSGGSGGTFGSDGEGKSGSNRTGGGGGGAAGLGGAIIIDGGTVAINRSTLMNNVAQGGNGGSSSAGDGGRGAGLGGAIFVRNGNLTVTNSTFTANSASQGSSGNGTAQGRGAAVFIHDGTVTLNYNTISDNTNTTGGTVYLWDDASVSGVLNMTGNIIANTTGGDDCSATSLTTNAFNLVEDNTCSPAVSGDPLLDSLDDYGGDTQTMALADNSPAIDQISSGSNGCGSTVATDQRGVTRPQRNACDIGAYEAQFPEIEIQGNGQAIVNGDAAPSTADHTDFGSVAVSSSITRTFTISNSGPGELTLSGSPLVTVTNTSGFFSLTQPPSSPVSSNLTDTFKIAYKPTASGIHTGTVTIENNDADEGLYNFEIRGNGLGLVISEIMYDPDSNDDWEWIELYNTSAAPIDLAGYVIDDNNSSSHSGANIAGGTVTAGGTAILFDDDSLDAADIEAAWGSGMTLIGVTGWSKMGLNNTGDQVSLWSSYGDYSGDHQTHTNAIDTVNYGGAGFPDPSGKSIYLTDLNSDNNQGANWATSTDGGSTPVGTGYQSLAAAGNSGSDIGSPGGTFTQEISVAGNGQIIADGDTTPAITDHTDFGAAQADGGLITRTFTISNSGDGSLALTGSPQVTLTTGTAYSVSAQPSSSILSSGISTTFEISFDPLTAGSVTDTVTIANNDIDKNPYTFMISGTGVYPTVAFAQAGYTYDEDGTAVGPVVTLSRSPASGASQVQVQFSDHTATGGTSGAYPHDYDNRAVTVDFNDTEASKTVGLSSLINDDTFFEADETLTMTLSAVSTATIGTQDQAGVTILDNDSAPTVSISDTAVFENSGPLVFTVTLNTESGAPVTFTWQTQDGTATTADSDYTAVAATAEVIPAGSLSTTVSVNSSGDTTYELDETVVVSLSNVLSGTLSDGQATGVIKNDDSAPTIAIADAAGPEIVGTLDFTVTLSAISGVDTGVEYTTTDNTATAGSDYTAATSVLTIPASNLTGTIKVTVADDVVDETSETFTVTLSSPVNGTILDGAGTGTITDNDTAGVTLAASSGITVAEGGANDSYTVVLDTVPTDPVTVVITPDGQLRLNSAAAGQAINLSFPTNSAALTPQVVTVAALDDAISEGSHTGAISHTIHSSDLNYDGSSVPVDPSRNLSVDIIDNDSPGIVISPTTLAVSEPDGTATFTVRLQTKPAGGADVALNLFPGAGVSTTTGGSTAACTASPTNIAIPNAAWATGQTVTVTAVNDDVDNLGDQRTCTITTGDPTSSDPDYDGADDNPADVTVTVQDDDTAQVGLSISQLQITKGQTATYQIQLDSKPTQPVTVSVSTEGKLTVQPTELLFTSLTWNKSQTVTVTATDDGQQNGAQSGKLVHTVTSSDGQYTGLSVLKIPVNIADRLVSYYLPVLIKDFVSLPDLVITDLHATDTAVSITIANSSSTAVVDAFWIDVYFDPSQTPSLNQPWQDIAPAGAVWGVTESLGPGESLTLTVGDSFYHSDKSSSSFPAGVEVYAYVDSINFSTSYGAVKESNESNNSFGPVTSGTGGPTATFLGKRKRSPAAGSLPAR